MEINDEQAGIIFGKSDTCYRGEDQGGILAVLKEIQDTSKDLCLLSRLI